MLDLCPNRKQEVHCTSDISIFFLDRADVSIGPSFILPLLVVGILRNVGFVRKIVQNLHMVIWQYCQNYLHNIRQKRHQSQIFKDSFQIIK